LAGTLIIHNFRENYAMINSGIEIFKSENGKTLVQLVLENETVGLNLNQKVEVFQRYKIFIIGHINNIFKKKDLTRNATVANWFNQILKDYLTQRYYL